MKKNSLTLLQRFFYKEMIQSVAFLLCTFFFLYVLIDLMTHVRSLGSHRILLSIWVEYYLCIFSKRLEILLPFAVLIATIRVLLTLQMRNELVALLASGIPMKKLLQPFLYVALVSTIFLYANYQWALPYALSRTTFIQQSEFGKEEIAADPHMGEIVLSDMSKVVYKSYDPIEKQFHDVFWIRSPDEIYHIKTLSADTERPTGRYVDKITRNKDGFLEKTDSWQITKLDQMHFDEDLLKNSVTPPNQQSLTQLYKQHLLYSNSYSDRAATIRSTFFYKLLFPLLALLAFIAPTPYCLEFRRKLPIFMVYLLSIAFLFCFFLTLQSVFVLAKGSIIPAWAAIGGPWAIVFYLFGKRYATL